MKTKMCIGVQVFYKKDKKGKRKYKSIKDYNEEFGFYDNEKYFMRFLIKDLISGDIERTQEMTVGYNSKNKKFINEVKFVTVTKQTVIDKECYTKLSGEGNEPRLRLTHKK